MATQARKPRTAAQDTRTAQDVLALQAAAADPTAADIPQSARPAETARTRRPAKPQPAKPQTGKTRGQGTAAPPTGKTQAAKAPRAPGANSPAATTPKKTPPMTLAEVRAFIEALAAHNPAPESELTYTDPFTLLVAVVLSAQATDASVNKATRTLFQEASTPNAIIALGVEGVARHIRSIGLWQTKSRNVVALAQALEDHHNALVPHDRSALESLPGVGRKTANVVLNVAFGEATMAVDTHIFRLGNRTGIAPGKTPREVEDALISRIPTGLLRNAHHWLILHGRYVCKARKPECWHCVAARWCRYPEKTHAPDLSAPNPGAEDQQAPPQAT